MSSSKAPWYIFHGDGRPPHDAIRHLNPDEAPPWRRMPARAAAADNPWLSGALDPAQGQPAGGPGALRGAAYEPSDEEVRAVNAALHLRRPILVEGPPGVGKSSLAYAVAHELSLGPVLRWPVNTRTTLAEGLYRYDAVARLHDAARAAPGLIGAANPEAASAPAPDDRNIGAYLSLAPLGTALAPLNQPRVLLIDEFDKGDVDLPNDLLNVLEEGEFVIPELARLNLSQPISLRWADAVLHPACRSPISQGQVRCRAFPLIVITSNGERVFPPAFLRRCIRIKIASPNKDRLKKIVDRHFPPGSADRAEIEELIASFLQKGSSVTLSTDQLLSAVYLRLNGLLPAYEDPEQLHAWIASQIFQPLDAERDL